MHGIIIIKHDDNRTSNPSDQCRGVLHTPISKSHPSENFDGVSHPFTSAPNLSHECTGVCNTPRLITHKCENKPDALNTSDLSKKHSSVNQQGVCNTPLRENTFRSPSETVGAMVRGYKSAVTKQMNQLNAGKHDQSSIVWQRSYYYEHIIRNPQSYQNIADYIMNNPAKWNADAFHTI